MIEAKQSFTYLGQNSQLIDNIKKKRPNLTKLDIEKLFQQSVELTQIHRRLSQQNKKLKKDFQKVEQAKSQRQQFISQVQKIVKQKSHQLTSKNAHQSSWLVFKLHQKIFDLKQDIQIKDKTIRKLNLSKQNQVLFRKQTQIQCLKQINQFAQSIGILPEDQGLAAEQDFQDIVWMDQHLEFQKQKIQQLQSQLEQQQRQTKRILQAIAARKTQLKKMKQMEKQYFTVQQSFLQEKKKKQQKMVDNKSYLTNLIKQRDQQSQKLQKLKQKRVKIQEQQKAAILKLQQKLAALKKLYEQNKNEKASIKQKSDANIKPEGTEQWVKRVTIHEVQTIAKNMNLQLALKGVTQQMWTQQFFKDKCETYSIEQIILKLECQPFNMKNQTQKKLLARYVVEDSDTGLMLEDMNTSQDAPIIKSILCKLIGVNKVYSSEQVAHYRQELGTKLSKFWSLVEQSIHIKQGVKNLITRQMLQQGIISSQLEFTPNQIDFAVLYLYSWSRDVTKLELNKLGKLKQLGIKFSNEK